MLAPCSWVVPEPLLHGGGQEQEVHSGTVAAPLVAGFAAAAAVVSADLEMHCQAARPGCATNWSPE